MSGLELAFDGDMRKSQHAMIYADCALRLSALLDDELIVTSLRRAAEMLASIGEAETWMSRPKHLAGQVRRRLREVS
jgi:hypothetical protein